MSIFPMLTWCLTRGGQTHSFWLRRSAAARSGSPRPRHATTRRAGCSRRCFRAAADPSNQRLSCNRELEKALLVAPASGHPARTIYCVEGMEFPGICVVMSPSTARGIIDSLAGAAATDNEEARKIYVGASRAQRLLTVALPRTQASRLRDVMVAMGGAVELVRCSSRHSGPKSVGSLHLPYRSAEPGAAAMRVLVVSRRPWRTLISGWIDRRFREESGQDLP